MAAQASGKSQMSGFGHSPPKGCEIGLENFVLHCPRRMTMAGCAPVKYLGHLTLPTFERPPGRLIPVNDTGYPW